MHDRALQHEIQPILWRKRPATQLQRVSREKLKRTIQKALKPTRTKRARRGVERRVRIRLVDELPGGANDVTARRYNLIEKLRRSFPPPTRIRLSVAKRERCSRPGPSQLKQKPLFPLQLNRRSSPESPIPLQPMPHGIRKQRLLSMPLRELLLGEPANEYRRQLPLPRLEDTEHVDHVAPPVRYP